MSVLSKKGYTIPKSQLSKSKLKELKEELHVIPKQYEDFKDESKDPSFDVFIEDDDTITVPKYYGLEHFGKPLKDELYNGRKIDIKFIGDLRDYQKPIADLIQTSFDDKGGGLISLPCGRGKTILAINSIVRRGVKTLVIVHKEFLINQWKTQIERFTNAKVGIIRRDKVDVEDKDIVIGMLLSIATKDYKDSIFSQFGLVIYDEIHHLGAKVYSKSLPKTTCRYTLGLSATPKRQDGCEKVFYWHVGNMLYKEELRKNNKVQARMYNFTTNHDLFKVILNWRTKTPNKEKMITNLTKIEERTNLIVRLINERRKRGDTCKILVLSRRRDHLTDIKKLIDKSIELDKKQLKKLMSIHKNIGRTIKHNLNIKNMKKRNRKLKQQLNMIYDMIYAHEKYCSHNTAYYVGGMKEKDLKISETKDVIFGTFDVANEGLDIPSLNTIVLGTPKPNVIQSTGRILRLEHYDISPEIIDISDNLSIFNNFNKSREKYYTNSHYNIHKYNVNGDLKITKTAFIETTFNDKINNEINNKTNKFTNTFTTPVNILSMMESDDDD
jgi:superfamily II DNA or RNA helicase